MGKRTEWEDGYYDRKRRKNIPKIGGENSLEVRKMNIKKESINC